MKKVLALFVLLLTAVSTESGQAVIMPGQTVTMWDSVSVGIDRTPLPTEDCERYYNLMRAALSSHGTTVGFDGEIMSIGKDPDIAIAAQYATIYMACKEHGK